MIFVVNINTTSFSSQTTSDVVIAFNMMLNHSQHYNKTTINFEEFYI